MSQWVKDNDVLNKVLFVPPVPRYRRLDFPNVLVWLGAKGERFPCLMLFPVNRKVRYVFIYFHGNGCDLSGVAYLMRTMMHRLQVGIIATEYPGYGISEGVACESSAKKCGRLTLEFVVNDLRVPLDRIVIFGTSIGTGVASWLAKKVLEKKRHLGALILQSPFTSIKAVLKGISIFESPVANFFAQVGSTFVADRFTNMHCLRNVTSPLLVLHGEDDYLIPVTHGKTLYEASKAELKKLVVFPNVGHNNFNWILVIKKLREFLERLSRYHRHGKKIEVEIETPAVRAKRRSPSGDVEQRARDRAKSSPKVTNVVSSTVGTIFGGAIGMAQALIPESKEPTSAILCSPSEPRVRDDVELPPVGRGSRATWQCSECTFENNRSVNTCEMCWSGQGKQGTRSSRTKNQRRRAISQGEAENYYPEGGEGWKRRTRSSSSLKSESNQASTVYL